MLIAIKSLTKNDGIFKEKKNFSRYIKNNFKLTV